MNSASISSEQLVFLPGNPQISVVLRRSRRSKRLSLRISRIKGLVTLSLPISCPLTQAKSFLIEKEPWIRKNLTALPTNVQVCVGTQLLYRGNRIYHTHGRKVKSDTRGFKFNCTRPSINGFFSNKSLSKTSSKTSFKRHRQIITQRRWGGLMVNLLCVIQYQGGGHVPLQAT